MKYTIKTFWCSMNTADSEKIHMLLRQAGLTPVIDSLDADIIIFNTCSVRQKWEDRVLWIVNNIKKQSRKNWKEIIVWITWCMTRKTWLNEKFFEKTRPRKNAKKITFLTDKEWIFNNDDELLLRVQDIDFTVRIEEIAHLTKILSIIFKQDIWNDEWFESYLRIKQDKSNTALSNVIIQTWCDNYCTFCIVPYTRWSEKSRNIKDIIKEVKLEVQSWSKEILLLWQNVNSYWKDFKNKSWDKESSKWSIEFQDINKTHPQPFYPRASLSCIRNSSWPLQKGRTWLEDFKTPFRELLEELDNIDWLERIRFTSSNPHDMTPDILSAHFDLDKTCNYLHFALQSWNNEILKKMNRKHSYLDFKKQVDYLRWKDELFSISTDIIVWFPGETEGQFQDTVKAMKECEFDFAYIARYSSRKWTFATDKMWDTVSPEDKARRWGILNEILYENIKKRASLMVWRIEEILITWAWKKSWLVWRTRNFKEVFIEDDKNIKVWDLVNVKILELDRWVLKGVVV